MSSILRDPNDPMQAPPAAPGAMQQQPSRFRPVRPRTVNPGATTVAQPRNQSTYLNSFINNTSSPAPGVPQSGGPGGAERGAPSPGLAKPAQAVPASPVAPVPGMAGVAPSSSNIMLDQTPDANPAAGTTAPLTTAPGAAPTPAPATAAPAPPSWLRKKATAAGLPPAAPGMAPAPYRPIETTGALSPMDAAPDANNFRGDTYTPGGDARLTGAQDATDAAAKGVANGDSYGSMVGDATSRYRSLYGTGKVDAGPSINTDFGNGHVDAGPGIAGVDANRYGAEQDAAVAGLAGPSRSELAKKALEDFQTQGGIDLENKFRKVDQSAAKFGRIGLGDVNAELGSIQGDYNRNLLSKQNELASSVAEGDINDRFRRVGAVSGLRTGEAGIASGVRGENRAERGYTTDVAIGNQDRGFARAGATDSAARAERAYGTDVATGNQDRSFQRTNASVNAGGNEAGNTLSDRYRRFDTARTNEGDIYGQGAANRGEMRTERGYQAGVAQNDLENRINQRRLGNDEMDQRTRRAIALQNAGQAGTPSLDELLRQYGG